MMLHASHKVKFLYDCHTISNKMIHACGSWESSFGGLGLTGNMIWWDAETTFISLDGVIAY
jgi:hypothetical protein